MYELLLNIFMYIKKKKNFYIFSNFIFKNISLIELSKYKNKYKNCLMLFFLFYKEKAIFYANDLAGNRSS